MYRDTFRPNEKTIRAASIIRLLTDAFMTLLLAYSCSKNIQFQVHEYGISLLLFVIFSILADMICTLLWQFSNRLFGLHSVFYILFGIVLYGNCFGMALIDTPIAEHFGFDVLTTDLPVMAYAIIAYIIGLIPLIMCKSERKKLKKENRKRIRELMDSGINR